MSISEIYRANQRGREPVEQVSLAVDAESALLLAVWAHVAGDRDTARACAERAATFDGDSEFARLLARYVADPAGQGVYDLPAAFRAFIRGGGNVELYERTSAVLRAAHAQFRPQSVLDVGVGDGLALLPAVPDGLTHLDLVEPSASLLEETVAALVGRGVPHRAHRSTVQQFARDHDGACWDLVQSSFAMQSLPPADRGEVLGWIVRHTRVFVLVEFDVAEVRCPFEPEWFRRCVSRVERGLREYGPHDRGLVGLGFVLPVILGHFDTAARTNYECSIHDWQRELREAGFTDVLARKLHDYWWEPAYVVEAVR